MKRRIGMREKRSQTIKKRKNIKIEETKKVAGTFVLLGVIEEYKTQKGSFN